MAVDEGAVARAVKAWARKRLRAIRCFIGSRGVGCSTW
jgi:hypothetical protein